jgi:hypothetical protein
MSVYRSEEQMRAWARERLPRILDRERFPRIFEAIDAPRQRDRLTITQLGVLRLLLDSRWRPDRDEKTQERYGTSACLMKAEIAEVIGVSSSAIGRAAQAINSLARSAAREDDKVTREFGLILFSDRGYCFSPGLGDTQRARDFSGKQLRSQSEAHVSNIRLADKKDAETEEDEAIMERIKAMTPAERERLLRLATVAA